MAESSTNEDLYNALVDVGALLYSGSPADEILAYVSEATGICNWRELVYPTHRYHTLRTPWNDIANIDINIEPLIEALWKANIRTAYSCQGDITETLDCVYVGKAYVSIWDPSQEQAARSIIESFGISILETKDLESSRAFYFSPVTIPLSRVVEVLNMDPEIEAQIERALSGESTFVRRGRPKRK